MLIEIPFGKTAQVCELDQSRIEAHLEPRWPVAGENQSLYISEALSHPIGSSRLRDLASKTRNVLIITSDNTRPVPSQVILPPVIAEIKEGSPGATVRLLVGTGLHRWSPSEAELREKLGPAFDSLDEIIVHSAHDASSLADFGNLSTGNALLLNSLVKESDLVIAEGFIEGHFFAGFTGGPKSVLPGVSGPETIMNNHSYKNLDNPMARCGVTEGNPVYEEMREASFKSGLRFIVNVVLDRKKRIISACAGHPIEAHKVGSSFALGCCSVTAAPAEIVITSNGGYPLDRNLYQLVKGISNGALTARKGGVIVACGECMDGIGDEGFCSLMSSTDSPTELLKKLKSGEIRQEGQWQAQILAKILERFHVIVVSRGVEPKVVESMHMTHARTLKEGLEEANAIQPHGRVTVLPDGPSAIPFPQ